jgi:hypothetical protein
LVSGVEASGYTIRGLAALSPLLLSLLLLPYQHAANSYRQQLFSFLYQRKKPLVESQVRWELAFGECPDPDVEREDETLLMIARK